MNRVKVTICGTEYKIASDEPAAYVLDVAREVDKEMRELLDSNPRLSVHMAAILCAVSRADDARKATADADNLRVQLKEALDENAKLRAQCSAGQLRF